MTRALYVQAPSLLLNPTLNAEALARARSDDPIGYASEHDAQFRGDEDQAFADDDIDAATVKGRFDLPCEGRYFYHAFVDMSGGRRDAAVLGIAHAEAAPRLDKLVLDRLVIADSPHDPAEVVRRFAAVLQQFGIMTVTGDHYGAAWVESQFNVYLIGYRAAELVRSEIYGQMGVLLAQRRVELLDNVRLRTEMRMLERRPRGGGRPDLIDHPRSGSDDVSNAAAGALWLASRTPALRSSPVWVGGVLSQGEPTLARDGWQRWHAVKPDDGSGNVTTDYDPFARDWRVADTDWR